MSIHFNSTWLFRKKVINVQLTREVFTNEKVNFQIKKLFEKNNALIFDSIKTDITFLKLI